MRELEVLDIGTCSYAAAYGQMEELLDARIQGKCPDTLILCEHAPVFTVGRGRGADG